MAYKLNGCNTGGLPEYLIRPIIDKYDVPYLVETGTASGESAKLAATMFKAVWTIEVIEGRAKTGDAPPNVIFLFGDSAILIPEIIEKLEEIKGESERQYVIFYLDAHYSDTVPNETGLPECPLLQEIESVAKYGDDTIIIIDDARLFFGHPPYPHDPRDWPCIADVFVLLKNNFPYHHITITDDYILCIPLSIRDVIDEEWRNRFHIRYPNDADKLRSQVKDVWAEAMKKYKEFLKYVE